LWNSDTQLLFFLKTSQNQIDQIKAERGFSCAFLLGKDLEIGAIILQFKEKKSPGTTSFLPT
jgi:hypothetical protein